MNKCKFVFLALAVWIAGCSSLPQAKLDNMTEQPKNAFRVRLESKGQVVVIQRLKQGSCLEARKRLRISIKGSAPKANLVFYRSCDMIPGSLVAYSHVLPSGNYEVKTSGEKVRATAIYEDAETRSGPDKNFTGALVLGAEETLKDRVDPSTGNASNWVKVKSKGGPVSLLLTTKPDRINATLFLKTKGSKTPQRIGTLLPGVRASVDSDPGEIYVKLTGKKFTGETYYSLTNRNVPVTHTVSIPVIDCYPVGANQSIVLLNPTENIKVNDQLNISAHKHNGEYVLLGKCTVNSISESQASCKLNAVTSKDFSRYKAEIVKEG